MTHPAVTGAADLVVDDARLLDLLAPDARVERLGGDATWSEGPVYLPEQDAVIWSDIPGNRILRWDAATGAVRVHSSEVEFTNGRTLDLQGRVLQCSHGRRGIERTEPDGETRLLVDRWRGVRFNSPNDLVVKSDGTIWFTDPAYGIIQPAEGHPGDREYDDHWVFRFDPATGQVEPVVTDVEEPNGLAFSPDESLLYVSHTSGAVGRDSLDGHHIRVVRGVRRAPGEERPGVRRRRARPAGRVPDRHRRQRVDLQRRRGADLRPGRRPARRGAGARGDWQPLLRRPGPLHRLHRRQHRAVPVADPDPRCLSARPGLIRDVPAGG